MYAPEDPFETRTKNKEVFHNRLSNIHGEIRKLHTPQKSICIVNSDTQETKLIQEFFNKNFPDYNILAVDNLVDAIEAVKYFLPDILFLDLSNDENSILGISGLASDKCKLVGLNNNGSYSHQNRFHAILNRPIKEEDIKKIDE